MVMILPLRILGDQAAADGIGLELRKAEKHIAHAHHAFVVVTVIDS